MSPGEEAGSLLRSLDPAKRVVARAHDANEVSWRAADGTRNVT